MKALRDRWLREWSRVALRRDQGNHQAHSIKMPKLACRAVMLLGRRIPPSIDAV